MLLISQNFAISGYVIDSNTGEKIIGAVIRTSDYSNSVTTNEFGYFVINCHKDEKILYCSYFGYLPEEKKISDSIRSLNFYLKRGLTLPEVVVNSNKHILNNNEIGTIDIPITQIQQTPTIGGESDIIKSLQLLPGVTNGTEGRSGLYVRGGDLGQNIILLDDVPLYYVNHLGGFVSTFNTDAIKNVKLIKGAFPASYGGRLSSLLDVHTKDGNLKNYTRTFTISLLTSKILLEGPIKKDTSSFLFSSRGFYWGFIYGFLTKIFMKNYSITYNFYDINIKYNRKLNDKTNIYLGFYYGEDNFIPRFYSDDKNNKVSFPTNWGNLATSIRFNKKITQKITLTCLGAYTRYRYKNSLIKKTSDPNRTQTNIYYTGISDIIQNSYMKFYLTNFYKIKIGYQITAHTFMPGNFHLTEFLADTLLVDSTMGNKKLYVNEINSFIENNIKIKKIFTVNLGIRYTNFFVNSKHYNFFEPRILLNIKITNNSAVKLSYVNNNQFIHLLTSNSAGFPIDLWLPSTNKVGPEKAHQYSLGVEKLFNNNLFFSSEIYYKNMFDLIDFQEGLNFYGAATDWENKIETNGKGTAWGLELLLQRKSGKINGWMSYSYSKSSRIFQNLNFGQPFPFQYDRRHSLNIVGNYQLSKTLTFSFAWTYGSGYPMTIALSKYYYPTESIEKNNDDYSYIYIYSNKNAYRMRSFHHLDIAINHIKKVKIGIRKISLSIYNVYNRQNPFFYYFDKDEDGNIHLYQQSLFPIIPSVSYSLKF